MLYLKNVPVWERWVRGIMGLVLVGAAVAVFGYSWAGFAAGGLGVMALMTGLVGFCPMCAMAGRKLK